ncbi:hypothetical protein P3T25_009907, partial [Paraburkholderia sp. GAS32]
RHEGHRPTTAKHLIKCRNTDNSPCHGYLSLRRASHIDQRRKNSMTAFLGFA